MKRKTVYITIILTALVSTSSAILVNYATSLPLPPFVQLYLPWAWPLVAVVFVVGVALAIWQARGQEKSYRLLFEPSKRNRRLVLERVQEAWIKGVLERSLHGVALLSLRLADRSDALAEPWRFVLQGSGQPERKVPIGTRISQVYDEADGELLILGRPGAGKTTLLLELARDLLDRATKSESYPIPIVFNLSTWAVSRGSLASWLIKELEIGYGVSEELGKLWVSENKVLLLLDGLDEVAPAHLDGCIEAINAYRRRHVSVSIAVCSRDANYFKRAKRLLLNRAVTIEPFTPQQIVTYLLSAGQQLAALRRALVVDAELRRLARIPLMLNVLTLAYQGAQLEDLLVLNPLTTRQKQVFTKFTMRMLQRRGAVARYAPEQMVHYLSWLATQLKQRDLTEFSNAWTANFVMFLDAKLLRVYDGILASALGLAIGGFTGGFFFGWLGILLGGLVGAFAMKRSYKPLTREISKRMWKWFGPSNKQDDPTSRLDRALVPTCLLGCFYPIAIFLIAVLNTLFVFIGLYWLFGWLAKIMIVFLVAIGLLFVFYYVLRMFIPKVLLWRERYIPWDYMDFLDYAVECILLRKVGKRYIFIHKLFLEYFAELKDTD